jgi:2-oxoisovalerate dehydrogenase E1 component
VAAPDPDPLTVGDHVFVPSLIKEEKGERSPANAEKVLMVDAALYAIRELMEDNPDMIIYGQDVGKRLGGVFREAATLAEHSRTPGIQYSHTSLYRGIDCRTECGGNQPVVEVQFAVIFTGFNQLVTEISKVVTSQWEISDLHGITGTYRRIWWRRPVS